MINEKTNYKDSFPKYLVDKVETIEKILESNKYDAGRLSFNIDGEQIEIPRRIYIPPPSESIQQQLTEIEKTILACLMTRHHNGHVREKYLRLIFKAREKWVIPFVIQLAGEYVVEILTVIKANLDNLENNAVKEFTINNADYFNKTKDRVRSYWQCYYSGLVPDFNTYVGQQIINELERKAGKFINNQIGR